MILEWFIIIFLYAEDIGVMPGTPFHTLEACQERQADIITVARSRGDTNIRVYCAAREVRRVI